MNDHKPMLGFAIGVLTLILGTLYLVGQEEKNFSGSVEGHAASGKGKDGPVPNEAVNHHRSCEPARNKESNCADAMQEIRNTPCDDWTRIGLQTRTEYRGDRRGLECIPRSGSENQASPAKIILCGQVNGCWLEVVPHPERDAKGWSGSYTSIMSDFKPIPKKLKTGKWEITFESDLP